MDYLVLEDEVPVVGGQRYVVLGLGDGEMKRRLGLGA